MSVVYAMIRTIKQARWLAVPVVVLALFGGISMRRTTINAAPAHQPNPAPAVLRAATDEPSAITEPTATLMPLPPIVPTSTPTATAKPAGPPRIGIQVGHWKSNELPDELAKLRTSTGAHAGGYAEADVNYGIAVQTKALLEQRGYIVDLLPATVPEHYSADAFVAIHADGSTSTASRGYKVATPWRTSPASQLLSDVLTDEYGKATGFGRDYAITMNMRGYYAFSRRYAHSVVGTTPSVIIETGFLTNATDRSVLTKQPTLLATGIANGVTRYLNERNPNDLAALQPPEFKVQRAISSDGVAVYAQPDTNSRVVGRAPADAQLVPFQQREGWYNVFVRGSSGRIMGWVRADQVTQTSDPTPTPPPATDS